MSVNVIPKKINVEFTYDDIVEFGREGDHWELFEGELVVSPPPNTKHQMVAMNLSSLFYDYAKKNRLGKVIAAPVGIYFDAKTFFEPDILFISNENKDRIKKNYIEGAPDVVIEIISPESAKRDRGYKFKRYALEGVREYWIVDPINENVEVYALTENGFQLSGRFIGEDKVRSNLFKELEFNVAELWD